jgi:dipeptidyl-peptidase-4
MHRLIAVVALFWFAGLASAQEAQSGAPPELQTEAERSGFERTTRHDDVIRILKALDERSDRATYATIGQTVEGRDIPMLVLADKPLADAAAARATERPVVLLMGNIHAGEVEGKEALLMLARDLVLAESAGVLEKVVVLVIPNYNPDGNERIDAKNRAHQTGPSGGVGVRENAAGLDLNRDYVKMDAPETRALVRIFNEWDPAVVVDCHTTNGSFHRYTLTYSSPRHPAVDAELRAFAAETFLPAVDDGVKAKTGYETFWYGDFEKDHTEWRSYPALPRYGEGYVGLRNRIAILSEAYVYAPFKDRVLCTQAFCAEVLGFAAENAKRIRELIAKADERVSKAGESGGELALRAQAVAFEEAVTVFGYVEEQRDGRAQRTDTIKDYEVMRFDRWEPTLTINRPAAYLIPPEMTDVVQRLQRHGIRVEETREDIELDVVSQRLDRVSRADRPFQGRTLLTVEASEVEGMQRVPAGWWQVRTSQPLGTLASYLLEPMAEDGLAAWGLVGELGEGAEYPVLRVPSATPILSIAAPDLPENAKSDLPLTYEAVYEKRPAPDLAGSPVGGLSWREDGEHYLQRKDGKTWRVQAATGRMELHAEDTTMAAALAKIPVLDKRTADRLSSSGGRRFTEDRSAFFVEHENDLYYCTMDGSVAVRLTSSPEREDLATFSPDGRFVAFVKNQNLWMVDVDTRTERQLTTTGGGLVECGRAGWVYFEELFNRNWQAYWWSPDSKRIAFLETDSTAVPEYVIVDDNPEPQNIERTRYPRVGEPNPDVRVGVVTIAGGDVRWADLSGYEAGRIIIPGVSWFGDASNGGDLFLAVQDRFQTWMDVCRLSVNGGRPEKLWRETTEAWVEWLGEPKFLKDGSFLWLSERTGWKHVYVVEKGSREPRPVTNGDWEVRSIAHVDEEQGWVYFTATADSHIAENLYRIKMDGSGMERLTREPGHHSVSVSPTGNFFIDTWSAHDRTATVVLRDASGEPVRTLDTNPVRDLSKYERGAYELVQIPVEREGREPYVLEGSILYPPGFDPEKVYPVWFQTYGGPHAPTVRDAWGTMLWEHVLAREGFILFRADPYASSGKGARSAWTCYKRLGVNEKDDVVSAVEWLKQRPYVDGSRIGMHGHSFGGYLTSYVMTHSDVLAAGIAGAPVTDWSLYDTIYMERYMLTPQTNPEGYKVTSVINAAKDLKGLLLITHGTMDDNVHFQNTIRLIDALQKAKKQFRTMILPGYRHGLFGDHYRRMMYEFIMELRDRPPAERPESISESLTRG